MRLGCIVTVQISFVNLMCLLAVLQRGAGCADPGTDEEGRQLVQSLGPEAARRFHGLSRLAGRPARLTFQYVLQ